MKKKWRPLAKEELNEKIDLYTKTSAWKRLTNVQYKGNIRRRTSVHNFERMMSACNLSSDEVDSFFFEATSA